MSSKKIKSQLQDFLQFKNGKSSPERSELGQIPVYGSNGIIGSADTYNSNENTIVVGRVGSYCGSVHLSKKKCWVSDNAIICLSKNERESLYWYYYLKQCNLNQFRSGSGQPLLNQSTLNSIECEIPNLQETRIKAGLILERFDELIARNQRINQTLEEMAQAIFKSWFVDFDPVKAKAQIIAQGGSEQDANLAAMEVISGKTRDQLAALQKINPEQYTQLHTTASLFPSAFEDSELGEIPEGWEASTIGNEVKIVGGGTPSTKNPEYWDDGIHHWTTPKDLSNATSKVLINADRKITDEGLATISSGLLPKNTVLMSSRAPVGYLALAKIPVAINQGYIAMICDKKITPEFTLLWANSMMDEIKQRASGTTFPEISKTNFRVIPVIVPTDEILNLFTSKVKPIYEQIETNEIAKNYLKEIRDGLLPKLLSGEIEV
jgi:type I restriction enzyme S subunit